MLTTQVFVYSWYTSKTTQGTTALFAGPQNPSKSSRTLQGISPSWRTCSCNSIWTRWTRSTKGPRDLKTPKSKPGKDWNINTETRDGNPTNVVVHPGSRAKQCTVVRCRYKRTYLTLLNWATQKSLGHADSLLCRKHSMNLVWIMAVFGYYDVAPACNTVTHCARMSIYKSRYGMNGAICDSFNKQ